MLARELLPRVVYSANRGPQSGPPTFTEDTSTQREQLAGEQGRKIPRTGTPADLWSAGWMQAVPTDPSKRETDTTYLSNHFAKHFRRQYIPLHPGFCPHCRQSAASSIGHHTGGMSDKSSNSMVLMDSGVSKPCVRRKSHKTEERLGKTLWLPVSVLD